MPDCRVRPSAPRHRKFSELSKELGIDKVWAFGLGVRLWCFCWEHELFDGRLWGWEAQALADEIGWKKDAAKLVEAMVKCKILEERDNVLFVHDFAEEQGPLIKKLLRERDARKTPPAATPEPQEEHGPEQEVIRLLMQRARAAKVRARPDTLRTYIEGWVAKVGAAKVEEILCSKDARGASILDIERKFFGPQNGGPKTAEQLAREIAEGIEGKHP